MLQHLVTKTLNLTGKTQPSSPKSERLRELRVPTDLKATWSCGGVTRVGTLKNISAGGCFILAENEVHVGDKVEIELSIPGMLAIPIRGLVVRGGGVPMALLSSSGA